MVLGTGIAINVLLPLFPNPEIKPYFSGPLSFNHSPGIFPQEQRVGRCLIKIKELIGLFL
jgi:hypothetical protein